MITLRKKTNKIYEDGTNGDTVVEITDPTLLKKKTAIQQQKLQLKTTYINSIKRLDDQLIQLGKQQSQLNLQNNQQQNNQQNNSNTEQQTENVNEGKNHKHEILCSIIEKVNNDLNLSYSLSKDEIFRMARKVIDTINKYKNDKRLSDIIKYELKKYCLNHNKISLSQSEINKFLNEFENAIINSNYNELTNIFSNKHNKLYFDNDTNVDELEAELQYLNIDIIDEDLYNNELVIEYPKNYNKSELKDILLDFNILKNNSHLFL